MWCRSASLAASWTSRFIGRPGAAVSAIVHAGAVRVKLDDYSAKVVMSDVRWQTSGASASRDRYEPDVSSGVVKIGLDAAAKPLKIAPVKPTPLAAAGEPASALEILLDGVESRVRSRR